MHGTIGRQATAAVTDQVTRALGQGGAAAAPASGSTTVARGPAPGEDPRTKAYVNG